MAYLLTIGPAVIFAVAFGLGWWLKTHPGHPVLQAIDDAALAAVKQAKLQQAATALASLGISIPATTTAAMPASSPPATTTTPPTK